MDADKKRIWIRGQFVEVTDEVYRVYMQGDRKMRYFENDLKTERFVLGKENQVVQIIPSREDSLDRLEDENAQQFSDEQESVESVVLHKLEVDRLHTALSLLAPEERALIQALFFEEKTERQYADVLGVYRNAVHVRKISIHQAHSRCFGKSQSPGSGCAMICREKTTRHHRKRKCRSLVCSSRQGAKNSRLPVPGGSWYGHDQQRSDTPVQPNVRALKR